MYHSVIIKQSISMLHGLMDHEEDAAVLLLIHAMISRSKSHQISQISLEV
jgi:hypothetical protein